MITQVLFLILLAVGSFFFYRNIMTIRRNILLGKDENRSDNPGLRWKTMALVALGQSKMVVRPVAGFFHILVYAGFILINLEVLEILFDGALGTHRVFRPFLGSFYDITIGFFEILGLLVIVACIIFLIRRNILKLKRFTGPDLSRWPAIDANVILLIEIVLMGALLLMNAADKPFQAESSMPVSGLIAGFFTNMSDHSAHVWVQTAWWFHFIGILLFLNYIPFSKHLHIFLAFPNTYYSNLQPKGKIENMESVTNEVKAMIDPSFTPPVSETPLTFGAKDVKDLSWKNLLDAYSCTECGRCTSVCPANQTGKILSPRKIMMSTRDRLEEVGKNIDKNGNDHDDGKNLHSYISSEELWACTTCNACAEACPVNINPVEIIVKMRQYQVMEQSAAPSELNNMFSNLENNGAPWQFSPLDRANWAQE